MGVLIEAILLGAMMIAAIFAGSDAWSAETGPVRELVLVVRPAVSLESSSMSSATGELSLFDIVDSATVPAADRELVTRHLKSVALTDRPKTGEERVFTQDGLETIVGEASRRLEAAGYAVEWKVPSRSRVVAKSAFSREFVARAIQEELSKACADCEIVIRRLDLPSVNVMAVKSWRLISRGERPRGSFAIPIEIETEDSRSEVVRKTMVVSGVIEIYSSVPVLSRAIQGGEKLSASDVKIERRNVTYALDASARVGDFEGTVVARNLASGEPVWKSSLRREQLLRFGDPVRVMAGGETWSVFAEGVAQGPAALGDSVRVKVGKAQKLVSGILKEKGLVEIQ